MIESWSSMQDGGARASGDAWNAFEGAGSGAATAQPAAGSDSSWAAFGGADSQHKPVAAAKSADPVAVRARSDLLNVAVGK